MKYLYLIPLFFLLIQCDVVPVGNPVFRPYPSAPTSSGSTTENQEFKNLMEKDQINKKRTTAEVLTHLLNDPDPKETVTAAVIENKSSCNIILRMVGIKGNQIYNLPIPRNSKNQFIIDKGTYTLKSNICGASYYSQKNISEPLILKLSN